MLEALCVGLAQVAHVVALEGMGCRKLLAKGCFLDQSFGRKIGPIIRLCFVMAGTVLSVFYRETLDII